MRYHIFFTGRFKKDVDRIKKRGFDMFLLKQALLHLEESGQLPAINKPHKLKGNYIGYWEGHLKPDWLIIWKVFPEDNQVWLTRTGTHSDLFE